MTQATPSPSDPRPRRDLLLFWGGVAGGLVLLRVQGRALEPLPWPAGFDWAESLLAAWSVVHQVNAGWPEFRAPLYPALLGLVGEGLGYAWAGQLLASLGMGLCVVAAGLLARALAGAGAGALAALSVPLVPFWAQAARWISPYPVQAGGVGLLLWLALEAGRRGSPAFAGAAGLTAAALVGMDFRLGAVALGAGAAMLAWRRNGLSAALLGLCFFMPWTLAPLADAALAVVPRPPATALLKEQRARAQAEILSSREPALEVCAGEPQGELPHPAALARPCARALLKVNARRVDPDLPAGWLATAVLLPLALLPGRKGRAPGWAAAAALLPSAALVVGMSAWVLVPSRYVLPVAAPLAALVPVGLVRLGEWAGGRWSAAPAVLLCLGAVGLGAQWLEPDRAVADLASDPAYAFTGQVIQAAEAQLGPTGQLLDCTGRALTTAFLPRQAHAPPVGLMGQDMARCQRWLRAPEPGEGPALLVTGGDPPWSTLTPGEGWSEVTRSDFLQRRLTLWRWEPLVTPSPPALP